MGGVQPNFEEFEIKQEPVNITSSYYTFLEKVVYNFIFSFLYSNFEYFEFEILNLNMWF